MTDWKITWREVETDAKPKKGGQGSVVKVERIADGRLGALKRLHEEHLGSKERRFRMQQEVSALFALEGKRAPWILDSNVDQWQDKEVPLWAVMEWVEGRTLQEHVNAARFTLDRALQITEQILLAVDECHRLGIHHRDLKHDNVILQEPDLLPVLVDFGMSWTRPNEDEKREFVTRQDQEIGNRFLRLPEHAAGRHTHHESSDLAMVVGLLLYMLTGIAPRVLRDANEAMPHEFLEEQFGAVLYDQRWPRLKRVFNVGFQFSMYRRFQSAQDVLTRLRELDPPADDGSDTAWREQVEYINDLRSSEHVRRIESTGSVLLEASQRYLNKHTSLLQGVGFFSAGSGPNLVENNRAAELRFFIAPAGASQPQVSFVHRTYANDSMVTTTITVEGDVADLYYTGPLADSEALYEAAEKKAGSVAASLLKKMRSKLDDFYRS